MFHVPKEAITKAFADYLEFRTGIRRSNKKEDGTLEMYKNAKDAFNNENRQSFKQVYDELLSKWGLRRGSTDGVKELAFVFRIMSKKLNENLRNRHLSELTSNDWPIIRGGILRMKDVKPLEDGISIMAISKFLHFGNPKLFVICDRTVMEQFVFGHKWLMKQRDSMDIGQHPDETKGDKQVISYLKLLSLSSNLIKSNPSICREFARTIRKISTKSQVPNDIETYEARAIEWFFTGLAESRPSWWENARCF